MENKRFLTAQDVMEMLDVSLSYRKVLLSVLHVSHGHSFCVHRYDFSSMSCVTVF